MSKFIEFLNRAIQKSPIKMMGPNIRIRKKIMEYKFLPATFFEGLMAI